MSPSITISHPLKVFNGKFSSLTVYPASVFELFTAPWNRPILFLDIESIGFGQFSGCSNIE